MPEILKNADEIINNLRESFLKKYGFTVFNVRSKKLKKTTGVILCGECLTHKQLNLLKKKMHLTFSDDLLHYDVKVLSDKNMLNSITTSANALKGIVNVTSDFFGEKLASQITPADGYFKVVLKEESRSLILLDDYTLGWVDNNVIQFYKDDLTTGFEGFQVSEKDKVLLLDSIDPIFDEAFKYVNRVKYLHGGKSFDGIDCSALMQLVFKNGGNIILPRHSLDQMKCGMRLAKADINNGALVFARNNLNKVLHVGLAFYENENMIIHSCLRAKLVIAESIDDFFKYYTFAGARRIVTEIHP